MSLPIEITEALQTYDRTKGFWRRLFGDQPAIRALRRLRDTDQTNNLKIYYCFLEHSPKSPQASYAVYEKVKDYFNHTGFNAIPKVMDALKAAKLLKQSDLDKLATLQADDLQNLAELLRLQNDKQLLTQTSFDNIIQTPESISFILVATELDNNHLIQESFNETFTLLKELKNNQLLTQENCNQLLEGHYKNALTRENLDQPTQLLIDDIRILNHLLKTLSNTQLLTQINFDSIIKAPKIINFIASATRTLMEFNQLTQENFSELSTLLKELHNNQFLTQENYDKLLKRLYKNPVLTQDNFDSQSLTSSIRTLTNLLKKLSDAQLLTQNNFDSIIQNHQAPITMLISGVDTLSNAQLLTQENLNYLFDLPMHAENIATTLAILNDASLLTSANRNKLYHTGDHFLLDGKINTLLWSPLSDYLYTLSNVDEKQLILDEIFSLSRQENSSEKIKSYMNNLLSKPHSPNTSTHTSRSNSPLAFFPAPNSTPTQNQDLDLNQSSSSQFNLAL